MPTPKVVDLPPGFTPTPFHTDDMMRKLVAAMEKLWAHCNVARMGGYAA